MPRKADKMNKQIMVRLTDELLAAIDDWRRTELDLPSRSEALRRLAIAALKAEAQPRGRKA
jgi:metal-responsive CopG/Arc/MetJ family transcriptional regulator